jgi:hypothetical protein
MLVQKFKHVVIKMIQDKRRVNIIMASIRIKEFIANLKLIAEIKKRTTVKSEISDVIGYVFGNQEENFDRAGKKVEEM